MGGSSNGSHYRHATERFLCWFSPVWMGTVATIVVTEWYKQMSGYDYLSLGTLLALPCYVGPALMSRSWEASEWTYCFKFNIWVGILVLLASWFFTHYFYTLLGVRYLLPSPTFEFNHVPLSMYLMAHPYFCTYHYLAGEMLTYAGLVCGQNRLIMLITIGLMAYTTALLEAVSIASFPGYTYPDQDAMFRIGSLFYGLLFIVSYPMFCEFRNNAHHWSLWDTATHSLACTMIILCLSECWRTTIGPISPLINNSECPPFTHPIEGVALTDSSDDGEFRNALLSALQFT